MINLAETVLTLNEFSVKIYKEDEEGNKTIPELESLKFCQNLALNEQIEIIEELDNDSTITGDNSYTLSFEIYDYLTKDRYNAIKNKDNTYWIEIISENDNTGEVGTHTLKRCKPSGTWTMTGQDNSIVRVQCEYITRYKG